MLDAQGAHPQPPVEGTRLLDGAGPGALTSHDLDQRQQVNRIEGVTDQHALGMAAARLDTARQQAGRARGNDNAGARDAIDLGEQRSFQWLVLGTALLDEVSAFDGTVEVAGEREAPARRAAGQPNAG